MSDICHNSGGFAGEALRQYVSRVEKLREELAAINEDIKQVYAEAKSTGFNIKALKAIIAERAKNPADVQELAEIIDLYRGIVNGTIDASARAGAQDGVE